MPADYFSDPTLNKLYVEVAKEIVKTTTAPARNAITSLLASIKGYETYLAETYRKVSTFRSLVNPNEDISTAEHYVSADFQPASQKLPRIDLESLIQSLSLPRRYIISAYAGYGKSMALRYMALSLYENPLGKIPVFIELRKMNSFASANLLSYINSTYAQGTAVSQKSFENALENGLFVFLFDGFDEINHEIRGTLESQILTLATQFPLNTVVVSGRPSENKYSSWRDFTLLKLLPMDKKKVKELIGKLDFESGPKKRFVGKLDGLYDKHQSFLSTPLLAILMLLTFQKNATIPDKMYLFYGRAFETIFNQHDAMKEQYERPRKTNLQIDEFSDIFATFCFSTYVKEKYEFTKTEIVRYLRAAATYNSNNVDVEDLLYDLQESVCLIVNEGGQYFFVHRSFQEYFAALFLSSCPETDRDSFLESDSVRSWDEVLPMLFDMSSDQIIATWLKRRLDEFFKLTGSTPYSAETIRSIYSRLYFTRAAGEISTWHIGVNRLGMFMHVVSKLIGVPITRKDENFPTLNEFFRENFNDLEPDLLEVAVVEQKEELSDYSAELGLVPDDVLESSELQRFIAADIEGLKKRWRKLERERVSKRSFIAEVLKGSS